MTSWLIYQEPVLLCSESPTQLDSLIRRVKNPFKQHGNLSEKTLPSVTHLQCSVLMTSSIRSKGLLIRSSSVEIPPDKQLFQPEKKQVTDKLVGCSPIAATCTIPSRYLHSIGRAAQPLSQVIFISDFYAVSLYLLPGFYGVPVCPTLTCSGACPTLACNGACTTLACSGAVQQCAFLGYTHKLQDRGC